MQKLVGAKLLDTIYVRTKENSVERRLVFKMVIVFCSESLPFPIADKFLFLDPRHTGYP